MCSSDLNILGMALMWFAPVQSLAFRSRLKLNLVGVIVLLAGIAAMVSGAVVTVSSIRALP